MTCNLDLTVIDPPLRDDVREAFAKGNAIDFVGSVLRCGDALYLVAVNAAPLKERGIYEKCLLISFTSPSLNHCRWPTRVLDRLFSQADPAGLRAAGDPIPSPGPFRLYRGGAGRARSRRPRGCSWTDSLDQACWFATRLGLESPAVLTALVKESDLLAYSDDRGEQEFVCNPTRPSLHPIVRAEMGERAKRQEETSPARTRTRMLARLAARRQERPTKPDPRCLIDDIKPEKCRS